MLVKFYPTITPNSEQIMIAELAKSNVPKAHNASQVSTCVMVLSTVTTNQTKELHFAKVSTYASLQMYKRIIANVCHMRIAI